MINIKNYIYLLVLSGSFAHSFDEDSVYISVIFLSHTL